MLNDFDKRAKRRLNILNHLSINKLCSQAKFLVFDYIFGLSMFVNNNNNNNNNDNTVFIHSFVCFVCLFVFLLKTEY